MTLQSGQPDYWIPVTAFGLALLGIAMISSASALVAFSSKLPTYYYFVNQLKGLGIATVVFFICAGIPYRAWRKWSVLLLFASILGLIAVFVPGLKSDYGTANSWIVLPVFGSFQPVEFTKFALIIYLASWMSGREHEMGSFQQGFLPFAILMASNLLLVALQPDFGSIFVLTLIATGMYFVAGANWLHIVGGGVLASILASFVISTHGYIKKRFLTFIDPSLDPEGIGYHIKQILIAVGSGGWWGLGFGRSRQKYHYMPQPQADSIFAVMAEELGFVRVVLILSAFAFLVWRGLRAAAQAPDRFGTLLATGFTIWIGAQTALNVAVNVSMAPMTGIPMPFISHGGSSLMMVMAAMGVLFAVSRESRPREQVGRSRAVQRLRAEITDLQRKIRKVRAKKL